MKASLQVEVVDNGYVITAIWAAANGQYKDRIEKKFVAYNGADLDAQLERLKELDHLELEEEE